MNRGQRSFSHAFRPTQKELAQIRACPGVVIYHDPLTQHRPEGKAFLTALQIGSVYGKDGTVTTRRPMESWEVIFEEDLLSFETGMAAQVKPFVRKVLTDSYGKFLQTGHVLPSPQHVRLEKLRSLKHKDDAEGEATDKWYKREMADLKKRRKGVASFSG